MSEHGSINPAACEHEDFRANVAVGRLTDGDGGPVKRFVAEVRVACIWCGTPFRFLGLPAGSLTARPAVSIDGLELRAPLAPGGGLHGKVSFDVPAANDSALRSRLRALAEEIRHRAATDRQVWLADKLLAALDEAEPSQPHGRETCASCGGSGKHVMPDSFLGVYTHCASCKGTGRVPRDGGETCAECGHATAIHTAGAGCCVPLHEPGRLFCGCPGAAPRDGGEAK